MECVTAGMVQSGRILPVSGEFYPDSFVWVAGIKINPQVFRCYLSPGFCLRLFCGIRKA